MRSMDPVDLLYRNYRTPPRPSLSPSSRVVVDGNLLRYGGEPIHLIGAFHLSDWTPSDSQAGNYLNKNIMYSLVRSSGGNFINIGINPELWYGTAPTGYSGSPYLEYPDAHLDYRDYIDTYISWCQDNALFFMINFHRWGRRDRGSSNLFSGPGTNYKVATPTATGSGDYAGVTGATMEARAISLAEDLVTLYKDLPNFVGLNPMNEPQASSTYNAANWNNVVGYYADIIDAVRVIDPLCIFFLQPIPDYGSYVTEFQTYGYVPRSSIVYEFHNYYNRRVWADVPKAWGWEYQAGNIAQGDIDVNTWHTNYVQPVIDDGYPTFCGEYSVYGTNSTFPSDGFTPVFNYAAALNGQMTEMNNRTIHQSFFWLRPLGTGSAALDPGLAGWNERGDLFEALVPTGLITP